jgi:diguanylate cyclase (GGDEF)-like protein
MPERDHVTGLATRGDLQATLERLAGGPAPFAVVICDVVGLKGVNEREGFLAGDAELRLAADRLRAAAATAELVARLGGDELVAVFTGTDAHSAAERAARDLGDDGRPTLRSAAVSARPGEPAGPLIERLYATMRRS